MNAFDLTDKCLSRAANNCLGELGPINLSTLILTPANTIEIERSHSGPEENNNINANRNLIQNLLTFLVHEDKTLRKFRF